MAALHITKIAFGCASVDELAERIAARGSVDEHTITTRYKPKRADELIGGSLFWIVAHRLVVRQRIIGFGEADGGRCAIRLALPLVPVQPLPRRAHQGWRYLEGNDAPVDLGGGDPGVGTLPRHLLDELSALALI